MNLEGKKHNVFIWLLTGLTVAGFLAYAIAGGQLRGMEMVIVTLSLFAVVGLLAFADLGSFGGQREPASALNNETPRINSVVSQTSFVASASEPSSSPREPASASPYLTNSKKRKKKRR